MTPSAGWMKEKDIKGEEEEVTNAEIILDC